MATSRRTTGRPRTLDPRPPLPSRTLPPEPPEPVRAWVVAHAGEVLGPRADGWVARLPEGERHLHLLDVEPDDALLARAGQLAGVRHEHLAALVAVEHVSHGELLVVTEHDEATGLADLRRARPPLSEPEALTVTIPIAQALAELHARGLVHGAVDETSVAVRPDGRPVLRDLRAALLALGSPRTDVTRLLGAVLAQMAPAELYAAVAREEPTVHGLLTALQHDPPEAERLVEQCFAAGEPAPVRLPDPASLAAAVLVAPGPPVDAPGRAERRARRRAAGRRRRVLVVSASGAAVVLAAGALGWAASGGSPGAAAGPPTPSSGSERTVTPAVHDPADPAAAAAELTRLRARALVEPSVDALEGVEVVGGPAHTDDTALVTSLEGQRRPGLDAAVRATRVVEVSGTVAVVEVASATTAHRLVAPDGSERDVPAGEARTAVLELRWDDAHGWRVWQVRGPATQSPPAG